MIGPNDFEEETMPYVGDDVLRYCTECGIVTAGPMLRKRDGKPVTCRGIKAGWHHPEKKVKQVTPEMLAKPKAEEPVWIDGGGRKILVKHMSDAHLMNTILMLQKRTRQQIDTRLRWNTYAVVNSFAEEVREKNPIYEHLVAEAKKRGFNIAEEGRLV